MRHSRNVPLSLALAAALALLSALAFVPPATALAAVPLEQKLTASDGAAGDRLGFAVAVDGDAIVIGAPHDNNSAGAVYAYQRVGDTWTQTAKLTASDGAAGDYLGSAVAIDGDTIVAGAGFVKVGENFSQGSVYTFARTGAATRTETAKLTASDGAQYDNLGYSVAIDGDTIVAGAPIDAVGANGEQGSVYTFARTGAAARTETAKLAASDGAFNDQLGHSVGIDGDTIVAGAYSDNTGANDDQGSVYTFARTGAAARTQTAKLTAADGAAGDNGLADNLGSAVAIDGDTIVAGAPYDDVGTNFDQIDRGSVYTFASTGAAARTETAKLMASNDPNFLGNSVAIDGDTIVAGASDGASVGASAGSAYTFARTGAAARTETEKLTSSDCCGFDALGHSVAIDGDTIVAGALLDDVGANEDQGSASVFFSGPDFDNDGVADSADACPAISSNTPSGCPTVARSLTLSYSKSKQRFKGTLASSQPSCVSNDSVSVWKKVGGPDVEVGAGGVNAEGKYVVSERGRPGKYYATVDGRVVADLAACGSATSATVRLR